MLFSAWKRFWMQRRVESEGVGVGANAGVLQRQRAKKLDWTIPQQQHTEDGMTILNNFNIVIPNSRLRSIVLGIVWSLFIVGASVSMHWIIDVVVTDWRREVLETKERIAVQGLLCQRDYFANFCDNPEKRAPAMASQCAEWLLCMRQQSFNRLAILAAYLADVVNTMIHQLSAKALLVMFVLLWLTVAKASSFALYVASALVP